LIRTWPVSVASGEGERTGRASTGIADRDVELGLVLGALPTLVDEAVSLLDELDSFGVELPPFFGDVLQDPVLAFGVDRQADHHGDGHDGEDGEDGDEQVHGAPPPPEKL
jgi:hypothetical protein